LVLQSATTAWNKGKHQLCWWLAGLEKVEDLRSLKMTCRSSDPYLYGVETWAAESVYSMQDLISSLGRGVSCLPDLLCGESKPSEPKA